MNVLLVNFRTKLTPVFSSSKIKGMFYLLVECSARLEKLIVNVTDQDNILDMRDLTENFTIDVIATCAFGIQTNKNNTLDCQFKTMARKLSRPGYKTTIWRMLRVALPR